MPNHKLTLTSKNHFFFSKFEFQITKQRKHRDKLPFSKARRRRKKSPEADIENHFQVKVDFSYRNGNDFLCKL